MLQLVLIFREDGSQVRFAEDQRPIEDFAAQRADEALADRVHPGLWVPRISSVALTSRVVLSASRP